MYIIYLYVQHKCTCIYIYTDTYKNTYIYIYTYVYYILRMYSSIVDFQPGNPHCVSHLLPPPLKKTSSPAVLLTDSTIWSCTSILRIHLSKGWNIDSTKIAQTALPEATFNILPWEVILSSCQKSIWTKKRNTLSSSSKTWKLYMYQ